MTTTDIFREDNTEGFSAAQLAELNRRWRERHSSVDPDSTEGKHIAEKLLEEIDADTSGGVVPTAPRVEIDGQRFDLEAVVRAMDDEIREELHSEMAPGATEQDFIDAYRAAHIEKFGEDFVIN